MTHALVLERDTGVSRLIRDTLERRGPYRVTTTPDAGQALNVLADDRPSLALVDDLLPDLAGWEFARKAIHVRVPVLMLAGSDVTAMRLRRAGLPFVPKPFHVEFLLQETRRLLREAESHRRTMAHQIERLLENRAELARAVAAARASVERGRAAKTASQELRTPSMWRSFKLQVVPRPAGDRVVEAPPAVTVRSDSNYYLCGNCGTLLVIADREHLAGFVVRCRDCGSCNAAGPDG
jgi:DNA-binding response OmpR family regulator